MIRPEHETETTVSCQGRRQQQAERQIGSAGPQGGVAVIGFKNPPLKQLTDQQTRYAPPARCLEQKERAEKLLGEVEPTRQYPYQYVCFRVTDYRPDAYPDLLIDGSDLAHDLRLMIIALAADDEPYVTVEEISKQWNVSTKTIRRWRKWGLVGRRIVRNGRQRLGFLQSVVDQFLQHHKVQVERGGRFSQLSDDEKEEILKRARRLSRVDGGGLTEVSRRIARRMGRSVEASVTRSRTLIGSIRKRRCFRK